MKTHRNVNDEIMYEPRIYNKKIEREVGIYGRKLKDRLFEVKMVSVKLL